MLIGDDVNRVKVVHVIQGLGKGGAEQLVIDLARAHPTGPINHSVVSLYNEREQRRVKQLREAGVSVYEMGKVPRPDPVMLARLIRLLLHLRPDIVHSHTFSGLVYGHIAAAAAGVRRTVHTDHASGNPATTYGRVQWLVDYLERHETAVVTFSEFLKSRMVAKRGFRPQMVHVIPNGVPIPDIADDHQRHRIRKVLGVGADEIFLLSVGGLRPQKNYQLLLSALARVRVEAPHLHLRAWIVGDGTEREQLTKLIGSLCLSTVTLAGERVDIGDLMKACDLYVNTSVWEAMPISVLEAMAAGRPVIASRVGMLPEILSSAGILVDAEESVLAGAIIRLATDSSLRSKLGFLARELVIERFSINRAAEMHEALYVELLDGASAGSVV